MRSVTWDFGDRQTGTGAALSHAYTVPGSYTARVTAVDSAGNHATGSLVIVVLEPPPVVAVATPAVSQQAIAGSTVVIKWSASGAGIANQQIQLSIDGGASWQDVVTGLPPGSRSYNWKVPNLPTRSARIRVAVSTSSGLSAQAPNPGSFSILIKGK